MTVYIGIDWSEQKHQVCFMNAAGAVIQQLSVDHSVDGFLKLEAARQMMGVSPKEVVVGLETAHNLLIDMLIERSYPAIYILPPSQVKSNAGRYAQSGAKDDPRDAWVIADMLRTDRGRLHAWQPDSLLTRQIQAQVRTVLFLTRMIQRQSNHLRAILVRYYPAMLDIFSRLDSPTSLAFLEAYPMPQEAARLTYEQFTHFLGAHHHTQRSKWATMYAQLNHDYPQAHPDTVAVMAPQAKQCAILLLPFIQAKKQALAELQKLYRQHPDVAIYEHLPGVGDFLAPALLAKLGDDRLRFPNRQVLQAVAGTCPITRRSGKSKLIQFRRACDLQFRYIVHQWAVQAIKQSPWVQTYYRDLLKRHIGKNDSTRRVANRLLAILYKLWQSRVSYDETYYLQQRALRAKPLPKN